MKVPIAIWTVKKNAQDSLQTHVEACLLQRKLLHCRRMPVIVQLTPKKSLSEYMNQTTTAHTPTRFQGKSTSPARPTIHFLTREGCVSSVSPSILADGIEQRSRV